LRVIEVFFSVIDRIQSFRGDDNGCLSIGVPERCSRGLWGISLQPLFGESSLETLIKCSDF